MGQISETYTGLHDANEVYGLEVSTTDSWYSNTESIWLWAQGTSDANYPNASFSAYGLYVNTNLLNSAAVDVNAIGGTLHIDSSAYTHMPEVGGIYSGGDVNNTGAVAVAIVGGTADSNDGGAVTVTSTGGTAEIHDINSISSEDLYSGASVAATATAGISALNGNVNNSGSVTVTGTAGTVEVSGVNASIGGAAYAKAFGIYTEDGDVTNTGSIAVTALGGTAGIQGGTISDTTADANAYAYGIYVYDNDVDNSGTIIVTATGGMATADETSADAYAYGIYTDGTVNNPSIVVNSDDIRVTAITEDDFVSYAYGLYMAGSASLTNTGTIQPLLNPGLPQPSRLCHENALFKKTFGGIELLCAIQAPDRV